MMEAWLEGPGWIPTFQSMLIGRKDTVIVMMGAEVEMTVSGEMRGAIEDGKRKEESKSTEIPGGGGVEVLNEIGTGTFIGDKASFGSI